MLSLRSYKTLTYLLARFPAKNFSRDKTPIQRLCWVNLWSQRKVNDAVCIKYRPKKFCSPLVLMALTGFSFFNKKKEDEEKEKEDPLIILLKWAKLYEIRHDLEKATDYYHDALEMLMGREASGEWSQEQVLEGKVYIYIGMANAAFALFQLDEAERLYKESIKGLLQQNKEKNDNAIIEMSLKLAAIYTIKGRFEEANDGYLYCIDHLDQKLKSVNRDTIRIEDPEDESGNLNILALLGMSTTSYGRFLITRKKHDEAYTTLIKALEIAKQVFGEDNNEVAVLHNDLATVASDRNDLLAAREHAQSAIKVGNIVESEDLPMFYLNLCYISADLKEWEQGRKCGRRVLRLAKNMNLKHLQKQALDCLKEIKAKMKQ